MNRHALRTYAMSLLVAFTVTATLSSAEDYSKLAAYKFGESREPLGAIEAATRGASADKLKEIESKLIQILKAPNTTTDCKGWICGVLRKIGTEASVAPVAALLADKKISVRACNALQSLPGADEALRKALPNLPAELQATVIQTIGARRDVEAVSLLVPLTTHANTAVATEALFALGYIGCTDALTALQKTKVTGAHQVARHQSLLLCADRLLDSGKNADAATAYDIVFNEGKIAAVRTAALRGLARSDKTKAATVLTEAMKSKDTHLRTAALQCLGEIGSDEMVEKALANRDALTPAQLAVLLESAHSKAFMPVALDALKSDDATLRTAGIRALGRIGTASEISVLLEAASKDTQAAGEVQAALVKFKDPKADEELIKLLDGDPKQARVAVAVLNARGAKGAFAEVLKRAAACTDEGLARELGSALTSLATKDSLKDLVNLMLTGKTTAVRTAAATAVTSVSKASGSTAEVCTLLRADLPNASAEAKVSALNMLATIGSADALALAREQLSLAKEPNVKAAAIRCLADWPNATPLNDLLAVAKESSDLKENVLALRGIIRMLGLPGDRAKAEKTKLLEQALAAAKRDEEKKQIEGVLARLNAVNLAPQGKASSPDGLDKDGKSGGDQAAIDGKLDTYWDEVDRKKQYVFQVDFPKAVDVVGLRITGLKHHDYAPRDFQVFCDNRSVKKVRNAQYTKNVLTVNLPKTTCKTVQLKITGYYGRSPAIRELEIIGPSK